MTAISQKQQPVPKTPPSKPPRPSDPPRRLGARAADVPDRGAHPSPLVAHQHKRTTDTSTPRVRRHASRPQRAPD
ncbi:hypothetical protein CERSUDRAFT_112688 [Gelatoporia subvermispora B]|uniref:Uncharacterized protein n=1 Tax=Ceriporiopsis subvermispora (strain B) TaxID=914234 RepID=M2R377_CERS8|nr:hypothetical protein CERSUDRAFT_112688 [Gelatoporia subvermispora B]